MTAGRSSPPILLAVVLFPCHKLVAQRVQSPFCYPTKQICHALGFALRDYVATMGTSKPIRGQMRDLAILTCAQPSAQCCLV